MIMVMVEVENSQQFGLPQVITMIKHFTEQDHVRTDSAACGFQDHTLELGVRLDGQSIEVQSNHSPHLLMGNFIQDGDLSDRP